ncbi:MAG: sulfotransferase family protein [Alphaproteobacteria bacterium]|nr:sulfotransferase family protein [Alphaproteobacteria bacterium]
MPAAALQEAFNRFRQGDYRRAIGLVERYLKAHPTNPDALLILGAAQVEVGEPKAAVTTLGRAAHIDRKNPSIPETLGRALLADNQAAAAVQAFNEAMRLGGTGPKLHAGLGVALARVGRSGDALRHLRIAAAALPNSAAGQLNLAHALRDNGQLRLAEQAYARAVDLDRGSSEALLGLAHTRQRRELHVDAVGAYREALRCFPALPQNADVQVNLAAALRASGGLDEAEATLRRLLAHAPANAAARLSLARTLDVARRFSEAKDSLEPLLNEVPTRPGAVLHFAQLARRLGEQDRAISLLDALAARRDVATDDRRAAHFELAALFDEKRDFASAFSWLERGHMLYDDRRNPAAHRGTTERFVRAFTPDFLSRASRAEGQGGDAVFIVGMPRSGTTLVEQILSSHSDIAAAGELETMDELAQALPTRLRVAAPYPEGVANLTPVTVRQVGEEYLADLKRFGRPGARRLVDKLPHNFQNLGLIALSLPAARVIHCRRHPLDTCLSIYFQDFGERQIYARDLVEIGAHFAEYRRLMDHWRSVLGHKMLDLAYEDLVAEPERVSRSLIAFLGLPWDDNCLNFHENKRVAATASFDQVRRPVYRTSVGRWQLYEQHLDGVKNAIKAVDDQ